jgi:non-ribosomal peptide synthetase component F
LQVQYADYARWQRQVLGREDAAGSLMARQLAYWRGALAGLPEQLELPADRPRPPESSYRGAAARLRVAGPAHARLLDVARRGRATLFMVIQAGLAALLSRLGAGTDIPVGTAIAGRADQALDGLIGSFVNTLVLRADVSGNPDLAELVARVREADLAAYAHQDLPFEHLVEALAPTRSMARHPLFQVMLVFQNAPQVSWQLPGLRVSPAAASIGTSKFDLSFSLRERRGPGGGPAGLDGVVSYSTDLFDPQTAEQFAVRLVRVLEQLAEDPARRVASVDLLTAPERRQLLVERNDTSRPVPAATLAGLFEAQVARTPDAVAVTCGNDALTYAQLSAAANRLAWLLIEHGIGPDQVVAVAMPRSAQMVGALLGVVQAGAAYLPVDLEYPAEHVARMLADAAPAMLLHTTDAAAALPADDGRTPRIALDSPAIAGAGAVPGMAPRDSDRVAPLRPAHPAYVIYTSGSTGVPKGVVGIHSALVNRLMGFAEAYPAWRDQVVCARSSMSSLDGTVELFGGLLHGSRIVLAEAASAKDPAELAELIARQRAGCITVIPHLLAALLEKENIPKLGSCTFWISTGEALPRSHAARLEK